ncbi:MAG: type I restriction-modification system subunit M N-terminal domain-containing protein [Dermatophilaceae bacterium]
MSIATPGALTRVERVITGELKSTIDRVWDAFWSGGISNPLEVIEQITYLLFIRRLDDLQTRGCPEFRGTSVAACVSNQAALTL